MISKRASTLHTLGGSLLLGAALTLVPPSPASAASGRERAVEQIPELMGRILESQEEIRERESEFDPVLRRYNQKLSEAKRRVESAGAEEDAAEALVDYVETYASRLEAQERGLRSVESAVVRMRADARELRDAADRARPLREEPAEREAFFADQFQGVAGATARLAERLGRTEEAATTGAVLEAGWASHSALGLSLPEFSAEGAAAFARRTEGLYARYQARSNQLRAERAAVRRLLDVLIERQLARRLDVLFAGDDGVGIGALLSGEGKTEDWRDLDHVVGRALGLPSARSGADADGYARLDRLDHFARGDHRRQGGR